MGRPKERVVLTGELFGALHGHPLVDFVEITIYRFSPRPRGGSRLSSKFRVESPRMLVWSVQQIQVRLGVRPHLKVSVETAADGEDGLDEKSHRAACIDYCFPHRG